MSNYLIEPGVPSSWRDLQDAVARILAECGVLAGVEKAIQTARGEVNIDVWAHDRRATPEQTYLLECKRWRSRVPKTVVHAFRAVVGDCGANWGAIISLAGFQRGAYAAAEYSNVRLLSWEQFQALFADRWFSHYFVRELAARSDALTEYTEPINSRIFRKADLLPEEQRDRFRELREAYSTLGQLCMVLQVRQISDAMQGVWGDSQDRYPLPTLPLRTTLAPQLEANGHTLPHSVLDAHAYRALLDAIASESALAVAQFDQVFGERA